MSDHAEYPPSSLENYRNCPGFLQHQGESREAEKGTRQHKAWQIGGLERLDEDERRAVQFVQGVANNPAARREYFVRAGNLTWGTIDYLLIEGSTAQIVDAKFGRLSVTEAQTNVQGWAYCLGVWEEFDHIDEIKVTFAVPYRDEVTTARFFRHSHQDSFRHYISRIIEKAEQFKRTGDASLLSFHPKTCSFCARANCPVKLRRLSEALKVPFNFPTNIKVGEMDASDISQAKIFAIQFKRWAEAVDKRALDLSNAGEDIKGFERRYKSGRREIIGEDVHRAMALARDTVDVHFLEIVTSACEFSVTKAVELIRDRSPKGMKQKNEEKFLDALRDADIGQPKAGFYYLQAKPEVYESEEK